MGGTEREEGEEREDRKLKVEGARKKKEERSSVHALSLCLYVFSLLVFQHFKGVYTFVPVTIPCPSPCPSLDQEDYECKKMRTPSVSM